MKITTVILVRHVEELSPTDNHGKTVGQILDERLARCVDEAKHGALPQEETVKSIEIDVEGYVESCLKK